MATWAFTNDYLEEKTGADLDASGVIGDGTPDNAAAPGVNAGNYADGDNYLAAGTLKSIAALNAVKTYFNNFNTTNGITWGSSSSYKYANLEESSANLKTVSSADIGNITDSLTVTDSIPSPASLSDLQSIKASYAGTTFNYNAVKGTAKELADSRTGGFDWVTNIQAVSGVKHASLTDLSASPTHLSALVNGLDANDYLFRIDGLTYDRGKGEFVGVVEGPSLAYRSDATPNATTSFAEGAQSYVSGDYTVTAIGFSNKVPEENDTFSAFNIAGDDASNDIGLKVHFYAGEQLSHVNISGATLSTTAGYKYSQTAGSGTVAVSDDIWTLELKLDAGQPAKTTAVSNNTGAEVLGVMINSVSAAKVGGNSDYGGSVFRTNAFWEDIDLMSSEYKFSDLSPGFEINGTNGEEVDFDFYFTKNYLERAFSTDFDAIEGGFVGSALNSVDASNDHTGSYIDVSKAGSLSELRLPVAITDVSATTAGGLTDFYEVTFNNDSWSKANLSMVYGPSINSAPSPTPSPDPSPNPSSDSDSESESTPTKARRTTTTLTFDKEDQSITVTDESGYKVRLMGGEDTVTTFGGSNNFVNGNQGDDQFIVHNAQETTFWGGKGADVFQVKGGADNFYDGSKGEDTFIVTAGRSRILGGDDNDTIQVLGAAFGTAVNGNRGNDFITGVVAGVTYRGGKDDDFLAVSQGDVWGDLGVDTFQGVSGDGYAVIQDYAVGEDKIDLTMVQGGGWKTVDNGLMFTDDSGDQIMLLIGIDDSDQLSLV